MKSAKYMTPSPVILHDDLIAEIISFLPVKYLLRFSCVSKYWNSRISSPTFVKLHLKKSAKQNPLFILITKHTTYLILDYIENSQHDDVLDDFSVVPYPMSHLFENPTFPLYVDPYYCLSDKECCGIAGTCNGLICLFGEDFNSTDDYFEYYLRLWNPATRKTSPKFGHFGEFNNIFKSHGFFNFKFGCDNSTGTYKVVAFRYNRIQMRSNVKILSFGDNIWRDIESFPVVPLYLDSEGEYFTDRGVYLSGTLNWLAIHNNIHYNFNDIRVGQFVIVSLDLGKETYHQYMLPRGFDEVPSVEPSIGVLGGCLCFSYFNKKTNFDFVIWKMKKFGVEESWSQLLKISCQNPTKPPLVPLLLAEDGDKLILKSRQHKDVVLCNWEYNRVKQINFYASTKISKNIIGREEVWATDYVESLVSIN